MYKYKFALNILIEIVCNYLYLLKEIKFSYCFSLFSLIYYCFLFIIVFDAMYMLLPLYVICSKIEIKK